MSKHLTHTQRNHARAERIEQRKLAGTYQAPRNTIDTQAQAEQSKRWRLDDLISDAGREHPNNPALLKAYKGGWLVNGGTGGRGKTIARTGTQTLDDALYVAALVKDAGYHIINSDLLTAE